jgi:hypothetical protein
VIEIRCTDQPDGISTEQIGEAIKCGVFVDIGIARRQQRQQVGFEA